MGVVRAVFGVAETGSVWLTEAEFKVSALGFLAQHLVVLLDPARIVRQPAPRLSRARAFRRPYGVFMTGPSATADIEGVLIHGAQGIRTLDGRSGGAATRISLTQVNEAHGEIDRLTNQIGIFATGDRMSQPKLLTSVRQGR